MNDFSKKKRNNSILSNTNSLAVYLLCAHILKTLHFVIHAMHYLYDIKRDTLWCSETESLLQILPESWHKIILSINKVSENVINKNGMGKYSKNLTSVPEDIINQGWRFTFENLFI